MVMRLDIFHWIHRFDIAIRTDSHSKYALFKSALTGAVLAYNRTDLELLIKAVREKKPGYFNSVSDEDMVRLYVSTEQLKHHVRRVTLDAQETFRVVQIAIDELKGLAGLDESGVSLFKSPDISKDGPSPEEEVVQPGQLDPDEDEAYQSDPEAGDNIVTAIPAHITLTTEETPAAHPPAFEDACSSNPLPGFQQLEKFCSLLVEVGLTEDKLSLTTDQRNAIIDAWNKRVKMSKRYAPAQQNISVQHNRLMYSLVKLLWLASPHSSQTSPEKRNITKAYERVQHCILAEDPVLSKLGVPLPKINTKNVSDFIRRQERLLNLQATKMPSATISKTTSVSSKELPPATCQPSVLPTPDYLQMEYQHIPSKAGNKILKERTDSLMPVPKALLQLQQNKPDATLTAASERTWCYCKKEHNGHFYHHQTSTSTIYLTNTGDDVCQHITHH
ncbi:hypothetical protein DPX16_0139 [Anabarilius grahami]|uniref:Uncharacterized protein n=1 Tax=Anabarilius grahami TaxID=495550 RepID=A0A3N0YPT5_ANAGA|nr:hypothetical protein DPX16_0139 [Anabarilius grahami]